MIPLFFLAFFLLPSNAHAYIDPGTGSMVFQMIISGALGVIFTVKMYWRSLKSKMSNFFSKKDEAEEKKNGDITPEN